MINPGTGSNLSTDRRRFGVKLSPDGIRRRLAASKAHRSVYPLSPEEVQALIHNTLDLRDRCVLECLVYCGMRRSEVAFLEIARLDFAAGTINVVGKGGQKRLVPMPPFLAAHLKELIGRRNSGPVFISGLWRTRPGHSVSNRGIALILDRAAQRAGVKQKNPALARIYPHQLRHTFARMMKDKGMQWEDLALLMGHKDPQVTAAIYGRHSFEQVKENYLRLMAAEG